MHSSDEVEMAEEFSPEFVGERARRSHRARHGRTVGCRDRQARCNKISAPATSVTSA